MKPFQQIINGDEPVLIDFYDSCCSPCKAMKPLVESIGKEVQGSNQNLKLMSISIKF